MSEKKLILSLTGAIVILSVSILISSLIISDAIRYSPDNDIGYVNIENQIYTFNENFKELIKTLQENKEMGQ